MKFLSKDTSKRGREVHRVELTKAESKLSDRELINLADTNGKSTESQANFGGTVQRDANNVAIITVYTD